jgi:hypothetical protein
LVLNGIIGVKLRSCTIALAAIVLPIAGAARDVMDSVPTLDPLTWDGDIRWCGIEDFKARIKALPPDQESSNLLGEGIALFKKHGDPMLLEALQLLVIRDVNAARARQGLKAMEPAVLHLVKLFRTSFDALAIRGAHENAEFPPVQLPVELPQMGIILSYPYDPKVLRGCIADEEKKKTFDTFMKNAATNAFLVRRRRLLTEAAEAFINSLTGIRCHDYRDHHEMFAAVLTKGGLEGEPRKLLEVSITKHLRDMEREALLEKVGIDGKAMPRR